MILTEINQTTGACEVRCRQTGERLGIAAPTRPYGLWITNRTGGLTFETAQEAALALKAKVS